MVLDAALRRTIHVALLALAMAATLGAMFQTWWTVDATRQGFGFRVFEARPFRSEAGSFLDALDGAVDGGVGLAGWLLVFALVLFVAAAVAPVVSRRGVRLPGWVAGAASLGAFLCVALAALLAAITWPDAWRDYTNARTSSFGVGVEHVEWDGRWTPAQGYALVYEPRPGWYFGWVAAAIALSAAAFDYAAARPWFPSATPPPIPPPPQAPATPPRAPPPPPDFTRRY